MHFGGFLLCKLYKDLDEKVKKSYVWWHQRVTLGSKNDMKNLVKFYESSDKSENLNFDAVLLLPMAYKVSAKKLQKKYLSWHWKKIKTLSKNWPFKKQWKVSKYAPWWAFFCRNYVMFELQKYRRVVPWKMTYGF